MLREEGKMYQEAPGKKKMLWGAIMLLISAVLNLFLYGFASIVQMSELIRIGGFRGFGVGLLVMMVFLAIPVFYLVASILGISRAGKPEKCKVCQTLGLIMLIAGALSAFYMLYVAMNVASRITIQTIIMAASPVIWPSMFYLGARENWKYAEEERQEMEDRAAREAAGLPPRRFPFN